MKELIIMAGLPGAGKTFIRTRDYSEYAVVDCDEIKKTLPNYNPNQPRALHAESKIAEKNLIDEYLNNGESFVYDTTATNSAKIVGLIQNAQSLGYFVRVVYVRVSLQTAIDRNSKRFRVVPEDIIREKYSKLNDSLSEFRKYADLFVSIDNEKNMFPLYKQTRQNWLSQGNRATANDR